MVPVLTFVFMYIAAAFSVLCPVMLFIYFRRKGAEGIVFFAGCAVFMLFAIILEGALSVLLMKTPSWEAVQSSAWRSALLGGLMAGIFEETGRFCAFSTVLKKKLDNRMNAFMYGAGHGGMEVLVVLGFGMVSNLMIASMINRGEAVGVQTTQLFLSTSPYIFLVGIVERLFAVVIHISLSLVVWRASADRDRRYLYPVAIAIHAAIDAISVYLNRVGVSIILIELVVCVMAALTAVFAHRTGCSSEN